MIAIVSNVIASWNEVRHPVSAGRHRKVPYRGRHWAA